MVALVAKKLGMSAVFEDTGRRIPVTVLQVFLLKSCIVIMIDQYCN